MKREQIKDDIIEYYGEQVKDAGDSIVVMKDNWIIRYLFAEGNPNLLCFMAKQLPDYKKVDYSLINEANLKTKHGTHMMCSDVLGGPLYIYKSEICLNSFNNLETDEIISEFHSEAEKGLRMIFFS